MKLAFRSYPLGLAGMVMWTALWLLAWASSAASDMQWVWSPEHRSGSVPEGACYFRRVFTVDQPVSGELRIAADDEYEVFLNARRIGTGKSTEVLDQYDVGSVLRSGQNLLAVRVTNKTGATAALGVRLTVQDRTRGTITISSDANWLTHLTPLPLWHTLLYNDARWVHAQTLGRVGRTPPWDDVKTQPQTASRPSPPNTPTLAEVVEPSSAGARAEPVELTVVSEPPAPLVRASEPAPKADPAPLAAAERPETPQAAGSAQPPDDQFIVELVLDGERTGSLLAMTFNEFGHIVASREQGGIVLIYDSNHDGRVDQIRVATDQIEDCRGLLCLNGELFATGRGPEGLALYRLKDNDRDGHFEEIQPLLKFAGQGGRHGPGRIVLGTDGFLYVAVGCLAKPAVEPDPASPYRDAYEGDLVRPQYEDPESETGEVQAPAGLILRLTPDGQNLQAVAGGLYDAGGLAIDHLGELFTQDSETATDWGTPWFRQAAVYHVLPGGEFGWREGASKWPAHFIDRLPATLETGRGVASGMAFYNHYVFPEEYRNALFIANWTHGRIAALKLKPQGASYTATSELFVDDPSLRVSDMSVGPDGALYFVTGDQGAMGGLYRIRWTGKPQPGADDWGTGLTAVVRQPQLDSAWSRQRIASEKVALGADWGRQVAGVAASQANPWSYRARALDLLQLFGPSLSPAQLTKLSGAGTEQVRIKAAELMGLQNASETREALVGLLSDSDRAVSRRACESLVRIGHAPPPDALIDLLKSDDRHAAWAARRLLERIPADQWSERLLAEDNHRQVVQAGLALLAAQPAPDSARRVLDRLTVLAGGFTTDRDFIDLLRVVQLALIRGGIGPEDAAETAQLLAEEFPSSDRLINRELIRLLTYFRVSSIMDRYLGYLASADVPEIEKLHLALHLPMLSDNWNAGRQIQLIEFLESARSVGGGSARTGSITKARGDFARSLSDEQTRAILAEGDRWPHAAVAILYRLPEQLDVDTRATLIELDGRLREHNDFASRRLKVGVVAVLARSGDAESLAHLRGQWERDPERRPTIAMGLAQWPTGENWHYVVRSLSIVESDVAQEVLERLRDVELAPQEPEYYRQVILRGLELGGSGAQAAVALLEHWTGTRLAADDDAPAQLAAWQGWFAQAWPDHPEARPPEPVAARIWQFPDVLRQLEDDPGGAASVENGAIVFASASCAMCHRCGDRGGGRAPDLTDLRQRLMRKEIVKSLVHPSESVSVPYLTKVVVTTQGRVLSGRISPLMEAGNVVLVQPDGQRVAVPLEDVEESRTPNVSDMPEGLLEPLTSQEISDLFAFLLADHVPQLARQPAAPAGSGRDEDVTESSAGEEQP